MTEQEFNKLSDKPTARNTANWGELASKVRKGIYDFDTFKKNFCQGIGVKDAQVKWALKGEVKSAQDLAKRVTVRYAGSKMFVAVA